jgi:MobA/MobL family.
MTKIPRLKGRISYIISPLRQENLYAVHETTERKFWSQLVKCNQEEFAKSGTEGRCIEARELIIALPEEFVDYPAESMLDIFTTRFKEHYGVECISALHHNKKRTNYHIHLIFSERKKLNEPVEKIATRNMFYDESGKHVRTKKEILGEDGQVRKGCKIVAKGEVYERKLFTTKDARFKDEKFLAEVKQSYTDLINLYVGDDEKKLTVFSRDKTYLPMKKIGKYNPKEAEIVEDNERRSKWNEEVDRALVSGVPEGQIVEIRKTEIGKKASQSIKTFGKQPQAFRNIIAQAIAMLELLISKILKKAMEVLTSESKDVEEVVKSEVRHGVVAIDERAEKPKMSAMASKYKRFSGIHDKVVSQNKAIYKQEKILRAKEIELKNCKGIFKGKERQEVQEQIN